MTEAYVCNKCFKTFYYEDVFSPFFPTILQIPRNKIYNRTPTNDFIGSLIESIPFELKLNICPICFDEIYLNSGLKHKYQTGYGGPPS